MKLMGVLHYEKEVWQLVPIHVSSYFIYIYIPPRRESLETIPCTRTLNLHYHLDGCKPSAL